MEVTIDTAQIVEAALIGALGQTNSDELVKAMAKTLLEGPGRYSYSQKTLLHELMANAVAEIARRVIDELLRDQEDLILAEVKRQLGGDINRYAADMLVKRIKDSKIQ